jgi:hypothetical protein
MFYSVIIPLQQVHLNILINCWVHANTSFFIYIFLTCTVGKASVGFYIFIHKEQMVQRYLFIWMDFPIYNDIFINPENISNFID